MSSTPRVFVDPAAVEGATVTFAPDDARHLRTVLRMHPGEAVVVLTGDGHERHARLTEVAATVCAAVEAVVPAVGELPISVTICQALPKSPEKVEQVLQHGTELGAAGFVLFESARSVVRLDAAKASARLERWQRIVKCAAEQSARAHIPSVQWSGKGLVPPPDTTLLVLHERATLPLRSALDGLEGWSLALAIGPEGGLTDEEVAGWCAAGGAAVSLGPRVLRTETAALAALAQIGFRY